MILRADTVPADALLGATATTADGVELGHIVGLEVEVSTGKLWAIFDTPECGRCGLPLAGLKDATVSLQHPAWLAGGES